MTVVLDASAVIALLNLERRAPDIRQAMQEHASGGGRFVIPATGIFEAVMGLARARSGGVATSAQVAAARKSIEALCEDLAIEEIAADSHQTRKAIEAAQAYGRATGHRAGLNFGDCFAYAAAKTRDAPLLFIGYDFGLTDLKSALEDTTP